MWGKIILILVGLASLALIFIIPLEDEAQRPYRQLSGISWNVFWLFRFFKDSYGGGPTGFSNHMLRSIFIFGVGVAFIIAGSITSNVKLELIGFPVAIYSISGVCWMEHLKVVERKANKKRQQADPETLQGDPGMKVVPVSIEEVFLGGNRELDSLTKEAIYNDLVEDVVQPYLSILLAAAPKHKRDGLLRNIYASVERIMASQDLEAKQVVLNGLILNKGSWWWNTSLPFMGDETQKALDTEVPMWRDLKVGTMPGCFPYADRFGIREHILS